jgi:hypothetical protein
MASTGLNGPFLLTAESVRVIVTAKSPGAYALGKTDAQGTFIIEKVGRSDDNVKKRLQDYAECFSGFMFVYCSSAKPAFAKECDLYHHFLSVKSYPHPSRPDHSYWKCPWCNIFD